MATVAHTSPETQPVTNQPTNPTTHQPPHPTAPPNPSPFAERNRANAQFSTGPRTPEGKAASSQNARKHGYSLTTHKVLDNEDPALFQSMLEALYFVYDPQCPREQLAVLDIAKSRWALRRLEEAETYLLNLYAVDRGADPDDEAYPTAPEVLGGLCQHDPGDPPLSELPSLQLLHRYRRPWDKLHQQAQREFDRANSARLRQERFALEKQRKALELEMLELRKKEAEAKTAQAEQFRAFESSFNRMMARQTAVDALPASRNSKPHGSKPQDSKPTGTAVKTATPTAKVMAAATASPATACPATTGATSIPAAERFTAPQTAATQRITFNPTQHQPKSGFVPSRI